MRALALLCLCAMLGGCMLADPNQHAEVVAAPAHLQRETFATRDFLLTGFVRITRPDAPLDLYIEGDGYAWVTISEPSLDPSPHEATGLQLAAADPAPNVAYLARPCQFTPMDLNPQCAVTYWTGKRYAPEVVASMNDAVDRLVARVPGQPVNLIGYSGGGAVAVLIAARRHDVATLRTVAGNLDSEYVNRIHRVSPMPQSLNPIDFARRVRAIAQIHFSGSDDTTVPTEVARRFADRTGPACARIDIVPGMTHDGDWAAVWPRLLALQPACSDK
ncbi:MAG: alpha/beta hydrolase [Bordetella sp.]|uniref:alpha/beta hydrolase n=1 Tax=Bordetella sp. TaxID=28081 RepID=UPI003F7C475C